MNDWNTFIWRVGFWCAVLTAIWWFFTKDFLEWIWPALTAFYMRRMRDYENWN